MVAISSPTESQWDVMQCGRPNRGNQSDFTLQAVLASNVVTPLRHATFVLVLLDSIVFSCWNSGLVV